MKALEERTPSVGRLREDFRSWLARSASELAERRDPARSVETELEHTRWLFGVLWDEGFTRWGWPPRVGGKGGSPLLRAVIIEELAYGDYANTNWFSMPEVLGPSFLEVASPKLVELALVPYLTGSSWWCQGFSEPEAGSDLASLRTRAEKQGGTFLINGQKVWTTMAHLADHCVLLARTGTAESRHRGITAFLTDMDSPGISVQPLHNSTGRAEFCEVFFEDVIVPEERVIGEIGGAWSFAMKILACERATVFWGDIAALYRKFDDLIPLAADGARGADRGIGAMFQLLHSLRARSAGTQRQAASGSLDSSATSVDKLLRTTCDQLLYDLARDFLGYRVAFSGDPVDVRWRHEYLESRAASIYGGSSEIQRNIIAERLLGLPRG